MSDIYQTFSGKSIFFTGVTGFVGKVFLYKLLKEFPDLKTAYVLCRPKKGVSMQARFEKEVLASPCFDPLRRAIGEEEWKRRASKVKPVAGDITFDKLGLSSEDYQMLTENVNFIVHMAATVDFQEKLNVSVNMNVLGSVRVLSLAQRCRQIEAFIHTSTCYVNFNRHGSVPVKEQLYPLPFDPEAMTKYILSLNEAQIPGETKRILESYGFPNTYTFTKNMTEHILMAQRGSLPFAIVRPAIVGAAWREPYNGWVDALTAAGGIFLVTGLGIMHDLIGNPNAKADIVPVDHVVNLLLKAVHRTALQRPSPTAGKNGPKEVLVAAPSAKGDPTERLLAGTQLASESAQPKGDSDTSDPSAMMNNVPRVYHSSTSSTMNPLRWRVIEMGLIPYWNKIKHPKAVGPSYINFYPNRPVFEAAFFVKRELPLLAAQAVNTIPGLRSEKKANLLQKYKKAVARTRDMNFQFAPFTNNDWMFENTNSEGLDEYLSPAARKAFSTDVFDINWHHYGIAYSWGLMRFIMKESTREQPIVPPSGSEQVLKAFM